MGFRGLSFLPFLRLIGISEYIYIKKKLINLLFQNFEQKENINSRSCFRSLLQSGIVITIFVYMIWAQPAAGGISEDPKPLPPRFPFSFSVSTIIPIVTGVITI